jgi:HlyD family secretion protein
MAKGSFRGIAGLFLSGAIVLATTGCDVLATSPPPTPTPLPKATPVAQRATVPVTRGTVIDAIKVLGRVVSSREADLGFRNSGRIREVYVQPGDVVQEGQVLAELDQRDLPWLLAKARVELERQQVRLAGAQAKQIIDDTPVDRLNVRAAEIAVAQAELNLERLLAGPADQDMKKVESDLAARQADLDRAKFDLTDREASLANKRTELTVKQQGPDAMELAKARADVELARVRLEQIKAASRPEDVTAAALLLDQEMVKLARIREQPKAKPEDLQAAKIEIEKAQVALRKVLADIDDGRIRNEQDRAAAVRSAQLDLQRAQNTYDKLATAAPRPEDIHAQEQAVRLAELNLAKVRAPAPQDVEAAQIALVAAETKLKYLLEGPQENELNAINTQIRALELGLENARQAISVGEANLFAATAKLDLTLRGSTDFDLRDARNKVQIARTGVEASQSRLQVRAATITQNRTIAAFDLGTLERAVEQAQLDVANYEAQTGDVKIIAPFAGKITRLAARPGDTVQAFFPVLNISSPEGLVVKADISEADVQRLEPGMPVEMTMDAFGEQKFGGRIDALPEQTVGSTGPAPERSTRIIVDWPGPGAEMGMLARVQITLKIKDNVLKVPNGAVRTVGRRQFVEYMDDDIKRSRNVETGISTDTETEITSGLQEGFIILAGQS